MTDRLEDLRVLIHDAAAQVAAIGPLEETLKWGQPSFAPVKKGIGSSVRLEERDDGTRALLFICTSGLVDEFRALYGDVLTLEGKRAIILKDRPLPDRDALMHCIQLALTHKLRKRRG